MARVLVADDEERILDFLDTALTVEGHEVIRATNGEDVLRLAAEQRPDVILLDVMMPVMDGLATARVLRQHETLSDVPIIMLTALARDQDFWRGWQAGVDSYLTKPFELEALHAEIARVGVLTGADLGDRGPLATLSDIAVGESALSEDY
jgi:DNA-binding response OmpR family regulator